MYSDAHGYLKAGAHLTNFIKLIFPLLSKLLTIPTVESVNITQDFLKE